MLCTRQEMRTWRALQKLMQMGLVERRRDPVSGEWQHRATFTVDEEIAVLRALCDAAPSFVLEPTIVAKTGLPADKVHLICQTLAAGITRVQIHDDGTVISRTS